MKFIDGNDDVENQMMFRKVSEDGAVEIAIHPVIYGFRVVAGYVGSGYYGLNYCAGNEQAYIEHIYAVIWTLLEDKNIPFDNFPNQDIKPMFKDLRCYLNLLKMLDNVPLKKVDLTGLHEKKAEFIAHIFSK